MKKLALLLAVLTTTPTTFAIEVGKVEFGPIGHYVASPKFGKLLMEATEFANGWKIKIDYTNDNSHRTTFQKIQVTVVGKVDSKFQKATFELSGTNGGWVINGGPVVKSEITEEEFINFQQ